MVPGVECLVGKPSATQGRLKGTGELTVTTFIVMFSGDFTLFVDIPDVLSCDVKHAVASYSDSDSDEQERKLKYSSRVQLQLKPTFKNRSEADGGDDKFSKKLRSSGMLTFAVDPRRADLMKDMIMSVKAAVGDEGMQDEEAEAKKANGVVLFGDSIVVAHTGVSKILSDSELQNALHMLPDALKLRSWGCVYEFERDGVRLDTFFENQANASCALLIIKTEKSDVFGAFCMPAWSQQESDAYYGTAECLVFRSAAPEADQFGLEDVDADRKLECFRSTGLNSWYMTCTSSMIGMGGGSGFSFSIDSSFRKGQTWFCETFNSPPLTADGTNDFDCMLMEVWCPEEDGFLRY